MMGTRQKKNSTGNEKLEESYEEQLMEKVCNKVVTRFEKILDKKFAEMEKKFSEISAAIEINRQNISESKESIKILEFEQDNLEQVRRKNNLRITGLKESEGEDILETVLKFLREKLNVKCCANDIDEVYRLKNNDPKTGIKTVIVKFVSNIKKHEVLQAKKKLKDLNEGKIMIFEDLTNKRYHLFRLAQKRYGKKSVWTVGGRIYTQTDNGKILISWKEFQ